MDIKDYCATCDDEEITLYGLGDTPEEALDNFLNCDFITLCEDRNKCNEYVTVDIWSVIDIKDSDHEDPPEHWQWCLDRHIKSVEVLSPL